MSQISTKMGGVVPPGEGILTLTGNVDVGGGGPTAVGPDGAGNIDFVGDVSSILVTDNAGANTLTISAANQLTATTTTIGNQIVRIVQFPLGAVPGVYEIEVRAAVFDTTTPSGAGWKLYASVRTDGITGTLIGLNDDVYDTEAPLVASLISINVNTFVNNTFNVIVNGTVGLTIDWKVLVEWTFVS